MNITCMIGNYDGSYFRGVFCNNGLPSQTGRTLFDNYNSNVNEVLDRGDVQSLGNTIHGTSFYRNCDDFSFNIFNAIRSTRFGDLFSFFSDVDFFYIFNEVENAWYFSTSEDNNLIRLTNSYLY